MMEVLIYKCCVNCYFFDDYLWQGEDSYIYNFGVQCGLDNYGVVVF